MHLAEESHNRNSLQASHILMLDSGWQWNTGRALRPIWDSSAGCTCISELMLTLGLEPSVVRSKRPSWIPLLATIQLCL
ncbi:unnamed protein product [Schistosoma margrebowiei]|uniref:Uncharacterized protein n=1 Tax=Schistosoma margrebowiei TaxID=48269 RepID=A0A183MX78_9TREM|nr:unnamed protein product [Schistosoma margrebowiei]